MTPGTLLILVIFYLLSGRFSFGFAILSFRFGTRFLVRCHFYDPVFDLCSGFILVLRPLMRHSETSPFQSSRL